MVTIDAMKDFLEYYDYDVTEKGLKTIYSTWYSQKRVLIEHLMKNKNWDEENMAIVFKENEYERPFNEDALDNFFVWADCEVNKIVKKEGIYLDDEINDYERLSRIIEYINTAKSTYTRMCNKNIINGIFVDKDIVELRDIRNKLGDKINKAEENKKKKNGYYIDENLYTKIKNYEYARRYIIDNCRTQYITDEEAQIIAEKGKINCAGGEKLTRVIQKICKTLDLDKIKDIQRRNPNTEETKDFGYCYQYALLGDAINPVKYKRITVISVNPMDYWGMSFGYKWASCHTIDKNNKRNVSSNHYSGCYSSGTESYMLDNHSLIFYVIREDYEGNVYYEEDKMQRVVFAINENGTAILESRVYPDGRDGGDDSLASQFRNVMQKVISETYEQTNYWTNKKGVDAIMDTDLITSKGTHYRDYEHYNDCNISIVKDATYVPKMIIGHKPICPCCGEEHSSEEWITCDDCRDEYTETCERCGDRIDEDDCIRTIDGNVYCCDDCAYNDGYRYCEDTYEWEYEDNVHYCEDDGCYHNDNNCYLDNYENVYYTGEPDVTTEDGNQYSSIENAESDGYREDHYGYWYQEDELTYIESEGEYYLKDDCIEMDDGTYFMDEEDASDEGYVYTHDGHWIQKDDAIMCKDNNNEDEDDAVYFKDEDEALRLGYVVLEDIDEYMLKKENAIKVDENEYYSTEEEAVNAGYIFDEEENEWKVA